MAKPTKRVVVEQLKGVPDCLLVYATGGALKDIEELECVRNIVPFDPPTKHRYFVYLVPLYDVEDVAKDIEALNQVSIPSAFQE